jgi:hypothetical protein
MALRLKRGTTAERLTYTPLVGELVYDINLKAIYIGDGAIVGGKLLASGREIIDDIVLNGNDITGTGNIDITGDIDVAGNIHATGNITSDGTITLGNNNADAVEFKAEIISNIVPDVDETYDLGTSSKKWNTVHANTIEATVVNGNTTGYHTGDITGSVFADNSTLLVDATSGRIVGPVFANVTGNTAGTHTGNVIGNVLGDVNGNVDGVVTGTFIGAVANADGTVFFDTRLGGGLVIPADIIGDISGSVFGQNSTRLIDASENIINTDGTVVEIVPYIDGAYRVGTREARFTVLHLVDGINLSDKHLRIESNKISAWGGISNNVEVTTTLSADIADGAATTNFTVASGSGIKAGAKFYLNGTSEITVSTVVGGTITATALFTPSGNISGQTVKFYNPSSPTPSVTFRDVAPVTSKGLNGDKPGMVFANANYIYFCIANWDGTTDIWVRTPVVVATF